MYYYPSESQRGGEVITKLITESRYTDIPNRMIPQELSGVTRVTVKVTGMGQPKVKILQNVMRNM